MCIHTPLTNEILVEQQRGSFALPYWPLKTPTAANEGPHAQARPRARTSSYITHAALLASLVAIVLLLTLCSSVQRKRKLPPSPYLLHRKLSDHELSPSNEPFLKCAPIQAVDTANFGSDVPAPFFEDEETAGTAASVRAGEQERTAKRLRLECAPPVEKSESTQSLAGPSSSPSTDMQRVTAPEPRRDLLKPFPEPQPEPVACVSFLSSSPTFPQQQRPLPPYILQQGWAPQVSGAPSLNKPLSMGPAERTADEIVAAEALLLLLQPPPSAAGSAIRHEEEQTDQKELHPAAPEEKGAGAEALLVDPAEGPSGVGGPSAPPLTFNEHFFVRVPALKPGVTTRPFNPQRARGEGLAALRWNKALCMLQSLLAENLLDESQAEAVLILAEQLVAHCLHKENEEIGCREPGSAAQILGVRVLLFDCIIAGLTAVGQKAPDDLWEQLAAAVPHTFVTKISPGALKPVRTRHTDLATRLSAALEALKTGKRLSAKETFKVKRMMFCSDFTLRRFKGVSFNLWRKHCADGVPTDPDTS